MIRRGFYTVPHASVLVEVLKVYYQNQTKVCLKLRFVYKSGSVIETKQYKLNKKSISHWTRVTQVQY